MMSIDFKKSLLAVLVATALTACGGGGGGGGDDPEPKPEPKPTPVDPVTDVTAVSDLAGKYDSKINSYACYNGTNDYCKLIIYQVMVEAAPNGGEADGKGIGWGPSNHVGTLRGIKNSLDFIKGVNANALWITPVFYTSDDGEDKDKKTYASGYYATQHLSGTSAFIDSAFGGLSSFNELVQATHDKEMSFILDGVFGHAKSDFSGAAVKSNKCTKMGGGTENASSFMTCFDWDSEETLDYYKNLATKMITEYDIDGWRFDQAYQVPNQKWKVITKAIKDAATSGRLGAGYSVAEVWSGTTGNIEDSVFKDAAVGSAFNFPLRYKLVQVIAGQENKSDGWATLQSASSLAGAYGYASVTDYSDHTVMPNMFVDNHDLVRFGNLLFRYNIVNESNVAGERYSLRHLMAFAFQMAYSGPITIYYGSEYGDYTRGFSSQISDCGTGEKWCDDHVSRTQMVSGESGLKDWQKTLRSNVASMMKYRLEHPALYNGERFHIYSTTENPADRDAENFYVDVKTTADKSDAFVFVMSTSEIERKLNFNEDVSKYVCQKAKNTDTCSLELVIDTSKPTVTAVDAETLEGSFSFNMKPESVKLYKVN